MSTARSALGLVVAAWLSLGGMAYGAGEPDAGGQPAGTPRSDQAGGGQAEGKKDATGRDEKGNPPPACPAEPSKAFAEPQHLPTLGLTHDWDLVASQNPIALHVLLPPSEAQAASQAFRAYGKVGSCAAFELAVASWKPPADTSRIGDLVLSAPSDAEVAPNALARLTLRVMLCDPSGKEIRALGKIDDALVSPRLPAIIIALAFTALLYVLGGLSLSAASGWRRLNPLWMSLNGSGRASLSNMQIIFFSVIVLFLVTYILLRTGILASLSNDVLLLLGIAAAGSTGGKLAQNNTRRLSFDNWAWAKRKGWTIASGNHVTRPKWSDLFTTDDDFDPYRFQMLSFSLVVGVSLLMIGLSGLAGFTVPASLLAVIGLSQATYIGGKAVTSGNFGALDDQLTALRTAEADFVTATASAWLPPTSPEMALPTAINLSRDKYLKFKELVGPAWTMFKELFVAQGDKPDFEPRPAMLPPT